MPNHIKNRLELSGDKKEIKRLIEKYSTKYEKAPRKSHDGDLCFENKKTKEYGWLNESTNIFHRREKKDVVGVPKGFEQDFDEAWTRFPDFNKIVPMPEGLDKECHSGIKTWVEICTGQIDFTPLFARLPKSSSELFKSGDYKTLSNSLNASTSMEYVTGKRKGNVKDFSEEDFNTFIQCLKNYRNHGATSWYEWSIEHWGTKWNSYTCEKVNENTFDFETAWSGVPELIRLMAIEFNGVKILYKYSDEDTGNNCGILEFSGSEFKAQKIENGSKEAYDLAFELRPYNKKYYKETANNYEYIDE